MQVSQSAPVAVRGWASALLATVAAFAAMLVVASLGLWLAGADSLPGGGFGSVVAATVLMSFGTPAQLDGSAVFVATAQGGITALPLSVSVTGALVAGVLFLRPLRRHAVVGGRELLLRLVQLAVVWTAATLVLSAAARHTFTVSTGEPLLDEIGGAIGAEPVVGFRVDPGPAVGHALLWLLIAVVLAVAVSSRTPLPSRLVRFHASVRPAAHAVLTLVLVYLGLGVVGGVVALVVGSQPRETLAVIVLGLPNLAWLALGVGLGASWDGHVSGSLGLPFPEPLAAVLRSRQNVTLDLSTLADQDGRMWLLLPLAAVLVLLAGVATAWRAPVALPAWRHALHLAVALAVAMLLIGLATRISAVYGLSLLGLGGNGSVSLQPNLLTAVPIAAGWGAVAGLLGGLAAPHLRRPGRQQPVPPATG
ncbi:streptophobe family protein [Kitasatospora cinereorecta]|uniref:Streptophobe family protein n=1 Tax=Kitasatospora cinereorecta TaxID=285560 RepID=A0ABW0VQU1_9ACTN